MFYAKVYNFMYVNSVYVLLVLFLLLFSCNAFYDAQHRLSLDYLIYDVKNTVMVSL